MNAGHYRFVILCAMHPCRVLSPDIRVFGPKAGGIDHEGIIFPASPAFPAGHILTLPVQGMRDPGGTSELSLITDQFL